MTFAARLFHLDGANRSGQTQAERNLAGWPQPQLACPE